METVLCRTRAGVIASMLRREGISMSGSISGQLMLRQIKEEDDDARLATVFTLRDVDDVEWLLPYYTED